MEREQRCGGGTAPEPKVRGEDCREAKEGRRWGGPPWWTGNGGWDSRKGQVPPPVPAGKQVETSGIGMLNGNGPMTGTSITNGLGSSLNSV